jgi:hypothetical protein
MKRIMSCLITVIIVLSFWGNASAVEKKQKSSTPPTKTTTTKTTTTKTTTTKTPTPPKTTQKTSQKTPAPSTTKPKKYDDFIDKNKNGIDDRKETPQKDKK